MKTSRYTEAQIIAILRQAKGGVSVAELCPKHGVTPLPGNGLPAIMRGNGLFYKWRAVYGGMPCRAFALQNPFK